MCILVSTHHSIRGGGGGGAGGVGEDAQLPEEAGRAQRLKADDLVYRRGFNAHYSIKLVD
jgi:hypothetical protein